MSDMTEAIQASGESTLKGAPVIAQQQFEELFNVSLQIAVTGESRTERSTFINTVRGLDDADEGAAETDVTETTNELTSYKHPTIPNVVYWDLPVEAYFQDVQFDKYDFFIIISSERFKENDIKLAKEIQQRNKLFYFIRSKIDDDIQAEEHKEGFNKEETLSKIKRNCEKNLKRIENPKVFLISSKDVFAFDFETFVDTLILEIPEHKQKALLQSVPVSSLAILDKKVKMFKRVAYTAALLSSKMALTAACDAGILVTFFTKCYHSFRLDDKSVEKLSEQLNKPHLKSLIMPPLVLALKERLAKSEQLSPLDGRSAVEYLCSLLPDVGSPTAERIPFNFQYNLLRQGLTELEDRARTMLREAGLQPAAKP